MTPSAQRDRTEEPEDQRLIFAVDVLIGSGAFSRVVVCIVVLIVELGAVLLLRG